MPLYKCVQERPDLYWGIWKVSETLDELVSKVSYGRRLLAECSGFASESRRKEWVAVRVLLQEMLGHEEPVAYLSTGKPFLVSGAWHISISHTDGYAAVALRKQGEVGVDIEQRGDRAFRLRERFMRADEEAHVANAEQALLHWSAKETVFKLMETEAVDFIQHIRILPFTLANEGVLHALEYHSGRERGFEIRYRLEADYVWTLGVARAFRP